MHLEDRAAQAHNAQIAYIDPKELHPYDRNARTHSRAQIKQIARSTEAFGFTNPVLINDLKGSLPGMAGWLRRICSGCRKSRV